MNSHPWSVQGIQELDLAIMRWGLYLSRNRRGFSPVWQFQDMFNGQYRTGTHRIRREET